MWAVPALQLIHSVHVYPNATAVVIKYKRDADVVAFLHGCDKKVVKALRTGTQGVTVWGVRIDPERLRVTIIIYTVDDLCALAPPKWISPLGWSRTPRPAFFFCYIGAAVP